MITTNNIKDADQIQFLKKTYVPHPPITSTRIELGSYFISYGTYYFTNEYALM